MLYASGRWSDHPGVAAKVVDTVGAGDTFQAALLTWLAERDALSAPALAALSKDALGDALGFAARAAAITCSRRGADMPRRAVIEASLKGRGALIQVRDIDEACELVNRIAPEHLELMVADPQALLAKLRHAGAVFLRVGGRQLWIGQPQVVGEMIAGVLLGPSLLGLLWRAAAPVWPQLLHRVPAPHAEIGRAHV